MEKELREYKEAYELKEKNPDLAIEKMKEYLKKCPTYYHGYTYLISLYINTNQFDRAKELINIAECIRFNSKFIVKKEYINSFKAHLAYEKIRLALYEKDYEKCLELCNKNLEVLALGNISVKFFRILCSYKLGLKIDEKARDLYWYKQLDNYSEEAFVEYIGKYFNYEDESNKIIFNPGFPVKEIVSEVKKNMLPENKMYSVVSNKYLFKFDNCGKVDNLCVDFFYASIILNTDRLITLYPCEYTGNSRYVDLNYVKKLK